MLVKHLLTYLNHMLHDYLESSTTGIQDPGLRLDCSQAKFAKGSKICIELTVSLVAAQGEPCMSHGRALGAAQPYPRSPIRAWTASKRAVLS